MFNENFKKKDNWLAEGVREYKTLTSLFLLKGNKKS